MTDPEKSIFSLAVLRIKKFDGPCVRPNGLGFFKPDPMLTIVGQVL